MTRKFGLILCAKSRFMATDVNIWDVVKKKGQVLFLQRSIIKDSLFWRSHLLPHSSNLTVGSFQRIPTYSTQDLEVRRREFFYLTETRI